MAFSAEEYKQKLSEAASIDDCEKVPVPMLKEDQNYIFISYSHNDYKLVYQDLADLYESGIPFWYDKGLRAGRNWDDEVRKKLNDRRCRGVIFYLSESLFLSRSIQTEIQIVCGDNDREDLNLRRLDFFSVNLTDMKPSAIYRKTTAIKEFPDAEDAMDAFGSWAATLRKAFPDKATYLTFTKKAHRMSLIEQIAICFNITPDRNPYEFSSADFLSGHAAIGFHNGSHYEGDFRNNAFSGKGTMHYSGGAVYRGGWSAGKHWGTGSMTYPDGTVYDGEWKDGNADGKGSMTFRNGSVYEGDWKAGKRHGKGVMRATDGAAYEGDWKNGERHGNGIMTYSDGAVYNGQWKNGERHGDGTLTYRDGDTVKGIWRNGELQGNGRWTECSDTYESDWGKSEMDAVSSQSADIEYKPEEPIDTEWHSEGIKHYLDSDYYDSSQDKRDLFEEGSKAYAGDDKVGDDWEKAMVQQSEATPRPASCTYKGCLKNGEPHGSGTMTYPNGSTYTGDWKNGERHGNGTMDYGNGRIYAGQWKNGERHGKGVLSYGDGAKFYGEWKNDLSCGKGTYYYPDGASRSGIWDGIALVEGSGVLRYDDGSWYDGEIRNNLRHGKGVYTLPDGTVQAGIFENDNFLGPCN